METTWRRASKTIFDTNDHKTGSFSAIFDYDIGNWTFGLHVEIDPFWFDVTICGGPVQFALIYWRRQKRR